MLCLLAWQAPRFCEDGDKLVGIGRRCRAEATPSRGGSLSHLSSFVCLSRSLACLGQGSFSLINPLGQLRKPLLRLVLLLEKVHLELSVSPWDTK